jgi:hypothetical protein
VIRFKRRDGWTRNLVASCINGGVEYVIPHYSNETWINDYIKDKLDGEKLTNNFEYGDCSFFYIIDESRIVKTSLNIEINACIGDETSVQSTTDTNKGV